MKHAIIMAGISGSGKTTWAQNYLRNPPVEISRKEVFPYALISADDYFMQNGKYCFDASKLGEAHTDCFARFLISVQHNTNVIVDNTNTTAVEIAPYVLAASVYGYYTQIISIDVPSEAHVRVCVYRNRNTHQVPYNVVASQWRRLRSSVYPSHWNVYKVPFHEVRGE